MIQLLRSFKEQSLPEKLFFFSLVVMVGAATLPWVRGHAGVGEHNAWQLGLREQLAMLVPVLALVLRLAALGGLHRGLPGGQESGEESGQESGEGVGEHGTAAWAWLRWYRFALPGVAAVLVYDLVELPIKGFGFWLACLALFIQAYALHLLLGANGRR